MHQAAYAWLGLDWTYGRCEVTPETLPAFVAGLGPEWRGLSCTMPLKAAVVALGRPDAAVAALGVANTVVFDGRPGDVAATRVRNTDVTGLADALRAAGLGEVASARVVGTGATAASALYALHCLGLRQVRVAGRNPAALAALRDRAAAWPTAVAAEPLDGPWAPVDLTVSTIPAAAAGPLAEALTTATGAVFDVLYDPWPTPLAAAAARCGRTVLTGLDLLAGQGVGQIELMTGRTVSAEVLLAAVRAARAAES
jgi:shikimate dehydrogenase